MPEYDGQKLSILALPIEPAYIGLSPKRPIWLPTWSSGDSPTQENISKYIKQSINNFNLSNKSLDLAALTLPINIDDDTWIDLIVLRASTEQAIPIEFDFTEHNSDFNVGSLLEKTLEYHFSEEPLSKARVMTTKTFPCNRMGAWHSDLESRGLYVPKCIISGKTVLGMSKNGYFNYLVDGLIIGYSSYWNNNWQATHLKNIRSLCGVFTAVKKASYARWLQPATHHFYTCKVSIIKRENSYSDFNVQEVKFIISEFNDNIKN